MEELTINGEKFAANTKDLLDWLVKNKIATEWERKLCAKGMNFRNIMSHLTHPLVFPPSYSVRALSFVADIINRLFAYISHVHSVQTTSPVRCFP